MMMHSNVHTHCTWCDGKNTPQEMIKAAIALKFSDIGFSSHSPALFDEYPSLKDESGYIEEINFYKKKYNKDISVLCGIEQDYYAPAKLKNYDYIIGSVHYIKHNNRYIPVDGAAEDVIALVEEKYNSIWNDYAKDFFELSFKNVLENKPLIVGHYDLIKKNNQGNKYFNENDREYKTYALEHVKEIVEILNEYGGMFEINTGAIGRGYRDDAYPSNFILEYLNKHNAKVIITTDSHSVKTLNTGYEIAYKALINAGFKNMYLLKNGKFRSINL